MIFHILMGSMLFSAAIPVTGRSALDAAAFIAVTVYKKILPQDAAEPYSYYNV